MLKWLGTEQIKKVQLHFVQHCLHAIFACGLIPACAAVVMDLH